MKMSRPFMAPVPVAPVKNAALGTTTSPPPQIISVPTLNLSVIQNGPILGNEPNLTTGIVLM